MNVHQARRRVHREARNHLHQRPGQARAGRARRGNDNNNNNPQGGADIAGQPRDVPNEVEPERPITYTRDPGSGLSWDGKQLCVREASHDPGVPVRGDSPYQDGPGKIAGTIADSPLQNLFTPEYVFDNHVIPQRVTVVFQPLMTYLSTETPPCDRASAQYQKTAVGMSIKRFPSVYGSHPIILLRTTEAFVHHSMYVLRRSKNQLMTVCANDGSELIDTRYEVINLGHPNVDANIGGVRREMATECALPLNWNVRTDMVITLSGDWFIGPGGHPQLPPGPGKLHHDTVYFCFRGDRQFTTNDNSPNNLVHGLKRVLGSRLGELFYRYHGLMALQAVVDQCAGELTTNWAGMRALQRNLRLFRNNLEDPVGVVDPLPPGDYSDTLEFLGKGMADILGCVTYPVIQNMVDGMKATATWCMIKYMSCVMYVTPVFDRRTYNAQLVHLKQALRIQYVDGVMIHTADNLMARRSELAVKWELMKVGKPPRLYGGYGAGVMTANEIPEIIKKGLCQSRLYMVNGVSISIEILHKPTTSAITRAFTDVIFAMQQPNMICWRIFSDDQIVGGNLGGHTFLINADISSNDSSQGAFGFGCYDAMACQLDPISGPNICNQNRLPMVAINPMNPADKLTIVSKVGFEVSGGSNTTGINHTGSVGIALCATHLMATRPITVASDISDCIHQGGALVGHSLTSEWCGDMDAVVLEKCQFLKHSPCRTTTGSVIAAQNLGPLLRSLGRVRMDMTSKQLGVSNSVFRSMSNPQRIDAFTGSVIAGHCHDAAHPLLDALRDRFPLTHQGVAPEFLVERDMAGCRLDSEAWCARYDTTPVELEEVSELIRNVKCGQVVHHDLFTRIYLVDYGL